MVAETVLDRFSLADPTLLLDTDDVDRDLRNWLHQQVTFLASPENFALGRALVAAAAGDPDDADALYQQLTGPGRPAHRRRRQLGRTTRPSRLPAWLRTHQPARRCGQALSR
jgi:tetracycline repressor-like protein